MLSTESPFSFISNQTKNNFYQFKNDLSNHPTESNNSDFFSIGDKLQQNGQSKTKQRFVFNNNSVPSQINEYLYYSNANANIINYAGNNDPLYINSFLKKNNFNNSINQKDNMLENTKDDSCPLPSYKNSVNSCMSASTFNSSINSINNNCNDSDLKIDMLRKDLGNMNLNDGMLGNKKNHIFIN